jgi:hypothetical protein
MKQSDIFREKRRKLSQTCGSKQDEPAFKRFQGMAEAWRALADEQDWLDGENRTSEHRTSA